MALKMRGTHWTRETRIIPASLPRENDVSVRRELIAPLQLSIHDYSVIGANANGITIILSHGTSFNKYFWELVIDYILSKPQLRQIIKRLIAIDAANHGDSAVLNRAALPSKGACWADDSRDILHAIKTLEAKQPVLGIGHSFGGGAMQDSCRDDGPECIYCGDFCRANSLCDERADGEYRPTRAAPTRCLAFQGGRCRGISEERESEGLGQAAIAGEHGTTDTNQDGSASKRVLKTPKEQEAATYLAAPHPEILDLLKKSNGRHHFIWGSNSKVISAPDRASVDKIIQPPSTSHTMPGAGHLIPMTHPETLSSILGTLIIDIAAPSPPAKL
ncbi:hypothetical protein ACJZ2D_011774 [Fusarium nematophilum]